VLPDGVTSATLAPFLVELPPLHELRAKAPQAAPYRALAAELGVPVPASLAILADAMATHFIIAGAWELFSADEARHKQHWLRTLVTDSPCLAPRAAMLPTFVRDGDLLLLDASGAVWLFSFSGAEEDFGLIAPTFDALVDRFQSGQEIIGPGDHHGFVWIDDVEYSVRVHHVCNANGCRAVFRCDLAPHVNRTGGDHAVELSFPEAPLSGPRASSAAIVATAGSPVDLRTTEITTRLVRAARSRGWTGRDGPLRVDDGRTWL
jgi:hypothetical protein